ncbi:MAG: hypothetical protein WD176_05200 [Pirellulales bacterium]
MYLEFDPLIPLALWVTLAVVAVGLVAAYAVASRGRLSPRRWRGVISLMGLAIVPPLAILLNPTWLERISPPEGKPLLSVLVDASASMATRDVTATTSGKPDRSRYAVAGEVAGQIESALADQFEIELRPFALTSTISALQELTRREPEGAATDLAAAISEAVAADRPQGQALVLISDGVHNAGASQSVRDSVARAKAAGVPIYTYTLGGDSGVRDIDVTLPNPQELAFVGQKVPVRAAIRQRGNLLQRTRATLQLEDKIIEERDVEFTVDGQANVEFPVTQSKVGLYRYRVSVAAHPDEVTDVNNAAALVVRVVDEPVRVLLLEGKPYWDTKFLVRALSSDPSITLTSVVRMAEGRLLQRVIAPAARSEPASTSPPSAGGGKDAPTAKTEATAARTQRWSIRTDAGQLLADPGTLSKYQIIILGRDAEVFLSEDAVGQLRRWLNAGDGSLICFRGAPSTQVSERLAGLLPVRWTPARESRFRVRLTPSGRELHWLPVPLRGDDDPLAKLPSLASVARFASRPALTTVLATTAGSKEPSQENPVVSYQPVGLGRVVVIEGAGMWRWAFLPHAFQQHDEVYGTLWRSLTRWLVAASGLLPSQKLALRTDQVTFSTADPVSATLLVRENQWKGDIPKIELSRQTTASQTTASKTSLEQWPRVVTPIPSGDAPGQFTVPFGKLPEGRYQAHAIGVDDAAAQIAFDVRGNLRERLDVAAQPDLMRFIADESGGAALLGSQSHELAEEFAQHLAKTRPDRTLRSPAWDRWWVQISLIAVWAAAWGIRRWSGLV